MLGFIGLRFPFDSHHVELSSLLIIGLPSFILAFEKHTFRTTDEGFIKRLLLFSGIIGFGNAIMYTILYTYFDLVSDKLFYSRSMLFTAVMFLGLNNIILIYLQHYSPEQIFHRKLVAGLLAGIFILFMISISIPQVRELFDIIEITPLDLLISFCFCAIGSMIIAMVLKKQNLLLTKA